MPNLEYRNISPSMNFMTACERSENTEKSKLSWPLFLFAGSQMMHVVTVMQSGGQNLTWRTFQMEGGMEKKTSVTFLLQ